jgi:beta-lactamase class A
VRLLLFLLGLLLVASRPQLSAEDKRADNEPFARLEAKTNARIGVSAIDLSTNRRVDYRSDERFIMYSTFKVLAAAAFLKRVDENKEKLDRVVPYGEAQNGV